MKETPLLRTILLAIGARFRDARIFRNNVGMAWTGDVRHNGPGRVIIENARPLHAGLAPGSSDLIGWTSVEITPEMVGRRLAVFTAVEVKQPGKYPTPEQRNFIATVQSAGGISGVARSPEDVEAIFAQTLRSK